jgi:Tol biopolymer transport system component
MTSRLVRRTALAAGLGALATACGGGSSPSPTAQPTSASSTITTAAQSSSSPADSPLPNSEIIAFERLQSGSDDTDLYVVPPGGGQARLVRHQSGTPHWSPDGRLLSFLTCLNPPDCTTAFALLDRVTGKVHGFSMPDPNLFTACFLWFPTGRELACEGHSDSKPALNGVYTIRTTDGQGLQRITHGTDYPLAFSPHGDELVFGRTDPTRASSRNQALFVSRVSGGHGQRITPWGYSDDNAGWSPDGRTIVFGTNGSLYRVHPDGSGFAKIALGSTPGGSKPLNAFDVSYAPDGQRIVFSLVAGSPSVASLFTARPDGSDVQRVTKSPTGDHHASWGAATAPG